MIQDVQGRNFEGLRVASISLTSAQILNSNTSPIVVVPAPPPGKMIVPIFAILTLKFLGVAYTGNLQPALSWGPLANAIVFNATFWGTSPNAVDLEPGISNTQATQLLDGAALSLRTLIGNPATGTSIALLTVYYTIENSDN